MHLSVKYVRLLPVKIQLIKHNKHTQLLNYFISKTLVKYRNYIIKSFILVKTFSDKLNFPLDMLFTNIMDNQWKTWKIRDT